MARSTNSTSHPLKQSREVHSSKTSANSLIRYRWYVNEDCKLLDVADAVVEKPDIPAVGVVDKDQKVRGILYRRDLLDLLGRPFGRDVMQKESVTRAVRKAPVFYGDTSMYTIYETLESLEEGEHHQFFPLQDQHKEFLGILSTQDLLAHLSQKTATDLHTARTIRRNLVRNSYTMNIKELEGAQASVSTQDMGGDFHFCRSMGKKKIVMGLVELPKDGVSSVMACSALYGSLWGHDPTRGVGRIVRVMNKILFELFRGAHGFPSFFIEADIESNRLLTSDMAHGQGFLYRNGSLLRLKSPEQNKPLGVLGEFSPILGAYTLEPDDLYIICSQDVMEQTGSMDQKYGLKEIRSVVEQHSTRSAVTLANELVQSLRFFASQSGDAKDGVFLVLKVRKNPA